MTAILSPEPVCNHEDFIQEFKHEFVPSALEYPASSPAEIELTGDHEYDIALIDNSLETTTCLHVAKYLLCV